MELDEAIKIYKECQFRRSYNCDNCILNRLIPKAEQTICGYITDAEWCLNQIPESEDK